MLKDEELWMKRQPCTGFSIEWIERWMELHATIIDGLSHINGIFSFLPFTSIIIYHS